MALNITNLRKGDIMMKYHDGSIISQVISFGQSITGYQHANVVHTGILCDQVHIVESQGAGVVINNLLTGNNQYGYKVFRPTNTMLGDGAATGAKMFADIHRRNNNLSYTIATGVKSLFGGNASSATPRTMDELMDRILEGRTSPFFCSHFVVYIYQFAAQQSGLPPSSIFDMSAAKANPARLMDVLIANPQFTYVGDLPASPTGAHQTHNGVLTNR